MKRLGLLRIVEWGLLAIMLLIVVHAPLTVLFGQLVPTGAETAIKAWKEIALTVLSLILVIDVTRRGAWRVILRDRLVQLILGFIGLHLLLAVVLGGDYQSVVAGLMIDLRFVVMLLLAYVVVSLRPDALRRMLVAAGIGAGVVIGFGLLQITVLPDDVLRPLGYSTETITPYTTIDKNPDFVRINSTLRGPNPLGAIALLYAALLLAYLLRRRRILTLRRWLIIGASLATSVAVMFASYSRSAYLAFAAAAVLVFVVGFGRISKRAIIAGSCVALVGISALALVSTTDWYSNVVLHEDPESTVVTKSNDGHIESLADGARRLVAQPFGAGVGSTGSASLYDADTANDVIIENYYFYVAHESGWLGLAIFIGLFGYTLFRLWKLRASWPALGLFCGGVGLALIGILLPVWADETVALIWWGLAGAVIAPTSGIIGGRHATRTRQQTATRTP